MKFMVCRGFDGSFFPLASLVDKKRQVSASMLWELAGLGPEEFLGYIILSKPKRWGASNLLEMPLFQIVNSNLPSFFHGEFQSMVKSLVCLEVSQSCYGPAAGLNQVPNSTRSFSVNL